MRLAISGEYAADWQAVSRATKHVAGYRCVRCRHSFDGDTGRPLPCTEDCDFRRGRTRHVAGVDATPNGNIIAQVHSPDIPGLNYGVHHLDGDKSNNAWWNLLALCNSCHLYVQASVIPDRPFLFTHSDWFIPYVCGYYAHVAGLAITRQEADADPARWLAIGQPWLAGATAGDRS